MNINQYTVDYVQFDNYVSSIGHLHFVIDFSTMLRKKSSEMLNHFRSISRSKCCFYVSKSFDEQITGLIDDTQSGFCTSKILDSIMPAWEAYSYLSIHTIDKQFSSAEFLNQLSESGHISCLVTGNETEAWRHIFSLKQGSVLLITDDEIYFFIDSSFSYLTKEYNAIHSFSYRDINDDGSSGKCETSAVDKVLFFFSKKHTLNYTEVISPDGAEGIIYKTNEPEIAVKAFLNCVSNQKIKKLEKLIAFDEKKENFAWPLEFVYSSNHSETEPIGFTMPYFENTIPLESLYNLDIATSRHRWKVAVSFLAQVLYLYLHGIQIGDYNANNFSIIKDECKVVFMDMDSYVYEQYGTQVHGRQVLPFVPDYSKHSSIIETDYLLLNSMIFQILADGLWPYYYDEDTDHVVCRMDIDDNECKAVLNSFPLLLRNYFRNIFEGSAFKDPFELLFILLKKEDWFTTD